MVFLCSSFIQRAGDVLIGERCLLTSGAYWRAVFVDERCLLASGAY